MTQQITPERTLELAEKMKRLKEWFGQDAADTEAILRWAADVMRSEPAAIVDYRHTKDIRWCQAYLKPGTELIIKPIRQLQERSDKAPPT